MPDQTPPSPAWEQVERAIGRDGWPFLWELIDAARAADASQIAALSAQVERLTQENTRLQAKLDGWDYTDAPKLRAELQQLRQQGAELRNELEEERRDRNEHPRGH